MFYRIRLDIAFVDNDPCHDILDKALDKFDDSVIINPDQPNEERSFIILEKCYHDEEPAQPCETLVEYSQ